MRVNLIVNSFPTISETFLFNLVTGLENRGIQVRVLALSSLNDKSFYKNKLSKWSGKITFLNWVVFISVWKKFFFKKERIVLLKILRKELHIKNKIRLLRNWLFISFDSPDIIHFSFSGIAANFSDVFKVEIDVPIFISCRGSAEKIRPLIDSSRASELGYVLEMATRIHCVSNDMKNTISNYAKINDKVFINFPSIDIGQFKYSQRILNPQDRIRIVSTGRLHYQKGYVYALNAIRILLDRGFDIEYSICGGGPEEGLLKYMIQELNLQDSVKLMGKVSSSEVAEHLIRADLFLLPSIYEGIANAAIEAMASGVPIISTTCGGMEELIDNGKNGFLVRRFSADEIARAIESLIQDPLETRRMSVEARRKIEEQFNLDLQINKFLHEYEKVVNNSL
jgi:colanic acid/amylovoran biosynthesis glycosyltransferase